MNYTQLQTKIASWLNRDDLAAVIPDFILLAEERINRHLRVRSMEVTLTPTAIVDNLVSLPSTTLDVKTLWPDGYEDQPLKIQSLEAVLAMPTNALATHYAWQGTSLRLNGGGSVTGVLYQRIPALVTATNNWLSDSADSIYIFGSLIEAAVYSGSDPALWESRFAVAVNELQSNDQRYSGPLVARAR